MSWTTKPRARPRIHKNKPGLKRGLQTGMGPNTTKPGQTEADHLGFSDFDRVFKDYDDSTVKPGMPFTGLFTSEFDPSEFDLDVKAAASRRLREQFEQMTQKVTAPNKQQVLDFVINDLNTQNLQIWFIRNWAQDPSIYQDKVVENMLEFDNLYKISVDELQRVNLGKEVPFRQAYDDMMKARDMWYSESRRSQHHIVRIVGKKVIEFEDGWAWWNLGVSESGEEGVAMGHCGNVQNGTSDDDRIYSLRKQMGRFYARPSLTFILNKGWLGEMKGRENNKPTEDYHPYIVKLLELPEVVGIYGGGFRPVTNFALADLAPEQKQEIMDKKPDFVADWMSASSEIKRKTILTFPNKWIEPLDVDRRFLSALQGEITPELIQQTLRRNVQLGLTFFADKMTKDAQTKALKTIIEDNPKTAWTHFYYLMDDKARNEVIESLLRSRDYMWAIGVLYKEMSPQQADKAVTEALDRHEPTQLWNQSHRVLSDAHKKQTVDAIMRYAPSNAILQTKDLVEYLTPAQKTKAIDAAIRFSFNHTLTKHKETPGGLLSPQQIDEGITRIVVEHNRNQLASILENADILSESQIAKVMDGLLETGLGKIALKMGAKFLSPETRANMIEDVIKQDAEWVLRSVREILTPKQVEQAFDAMTPYRVLQGYWDELTPENKLKYTRLAIQNDPVWVLSELDQRNLPTEIIKEAMDAVGPDVFWDYPFIFRRATPEQIDAKLSGLTFRELINQSHSLREVLSPQQFGKVVEKEFKKQVAKLKTKHAGNGMSVVLGHPDVFDQSHISRVINTLITNKGPVDALQLLMSNFPNTLTPEQKILVVQLISDQNPEWVLSDYWGQANAEQRQYAITQLSEKDPGLLISYDRAVEAMTPEQKNKVVERLIETDPTIFYKNSPLLTKEQREKVIQKTLSTAPRWALDVYGDYLSVDQMRVAVDALVASNDTGDLIRALDNYGDKLSDEQKREAVEKILQEGSHMRFLLEEQRQFLSREQTDAALRKLGEFYTPNDMVAKYHKLMSPEMLNQSINKAIQDYPNGVYRELWPILTPEQKIMWGEKRGYPQRIFNGEADAFIVLRKFIDALRPEDRAKVLQHGVITGTPSEILMESSDLLTPETRQQVVQRLVQEQPSIAIQWYNGSYLIVEDLTPDQLQALGLQSVEEKVNDLLQRDPLGALQRAFNHLSPEQVQSCIDATQPHLILRDIYDKLTDQQKTDTVERLVKEDPERAEREFDHLLSPEQRQRVVDALHPHGGRERYASVQCAYCRKPMTLFEEKQVLYCPHCRRTLAVDTGRHNYNYEAERETKGEEVANNNPTPYDTNFDSQQYPTRVPGDLF